MNTKMGGDHIPGPLDIMRDFHWLPKMKGKEREEAKARIEIWLDKKSNRVRAEILSWSKRH